MSSCTTLPKVRNHLASGVSVDIMRSGEKTAHVATIDLRYAKIEIAEARNGLTPTSEIAREKNALVAINGGFFGSDDKPVGALKIQGSWISRPNKLRGVVGFDDKHGMIFDRLTKDETIHQDAQDNFASPGWWENVDNILGGAPLLLVNAKIVDPSPEKTLSTFINDQYGRTAICQVDNYTVKFVVIDGGDRKANMITGPQGMNVAELASFLLSLGCKNALNLDGGYSSAFVVNGSKRNRYSIATMPERAVSTVLIVLPR